ncbi:MAG: hypothetical protein ABI553_01140 [Chloroflexota bacterium]
MTSAPRRRRSRRPLGALVALALVACVVGVAAISADALGTGRLFDRVVARVDRFMAGPVPERPAPVTVLVSDPPEETDAPEASPTVTAGASSTLASPAPGATALPSATPIPRRPVNVDIVNDHAAVFAHELKVTWCASAGVQMTLAILRLGDTSNAFQRTIQGRVGEWESAADSHNGDWGPSAMALALDAYGAKGYQVRAYRSRQGALRDAARAIEKTHSPVLLLAWRGAHTWLMTGFRADADPALFSNAKISGTYILDPWYPDVSSIWGPSDPPGTFQDNAEMIRNYLPWKRPEGHYAERDGLFIAVVPTIVVTPAQ